MTMPSLNHGHAYRGMGIISISKSMGLLITPIRLVLVVSSSYTRTLSIYILTVGTIGIVNKLLKILKKKSLWLYRQCVVIKGVGPSIPLGGTRVIRTPVPDSFSRCYGLGSRLVNV